MNAIEIKDLSFRYLGNPEKIIEIPEMAISKGESVLITGRSGSGKSTLINCINGIIPHIISGTMEGSVKINGRSTTEMRVSDISLQVGTLLQDPEKQVMNYKVEEEVAFAPENFNLPREEILERVDRAMKAVGIGHLRGRETSKLSGGELQRVALASVLTMDPPIMILDEPTSNIDPEGTRDIFEFLKKEAGKRTLIIVEHKVERVLPFVDRVIVMDRGKVAIDSPKDGLISDVDRLLDMGIEIPEHFLLANKLGLKTPDIETIKEEIRRGRIELQKRKRAITETNYFKASASVKYGNEFSLAATMSSGKGTIHAIVGRNGAGKSTFLKALIGYLEKKYADVNSKIEIDGEAIVNPDIYVRGRKIGYLPQSFDLMLINRNVERELTYSMRVRKDYELSKLVLELTKSLSLTNYLGFDPQMLSQGQRRRVAMAATIAGGVKIIMLDEPTSGQDFYHKEELGKELVSLKAKGYVFIIVTHDVRFVYKYADRVSLIDSGRVQLEGTPEEVFSKSESFGIPPPSEYLLRC
ncbi:MAG: ATP-binding cassette domain-containing protein [Candidatus Micrarchaeaceae archaeon]